MNAEPSTANVLAIPQTSAPELSPTAVASESGQQEATTSAAPVEPPTPSAAPAKTETVGHITVGLTPRETAKPVKRRDLPAQPDFEAVRADAIAKGYVFALVDRSTGEARFDHERVYHEPNCPSVTPAMRAGPSKDAVAAGYTPAWDCHHDQH
jgi:hypothetical protein